MKKIVPAFYLILSLAFAAAIGTSQQQPDFKKDNFYLGQNQQLEIEIHVWGEVNTPGVYRVPDGSTVLDVISKAGGPTEYAALGRVKVSHTLGQVPRTVKVNLNKYLNKDRADSLMVMRPGDAVMVPRNARFFWKDAISFIADIVVIANVYYLISRNR
ncbi:SLBB domain-containing protein [candidate division TA06 bacterium]|uniref:SLBB domain-containing protein n=1 Tax=candidate division TA06 bacterium TaxID=2250710 RepID=A0A933I8Z3_UNCT6|nr:SLBB domain-containing protein [candidate division TA06 bacterium]